jgi:hypothetical protein
MKLCFVHVANAEIYRCGVKDAAGLAVKYLTKLAVSRMFCTRILLLHYFPDVNQSTLKIQFFSPSECSDELLEACENTEKIFSVDSWPQSRRGHEFEGNSLFVLLEPC